MADARTPDPVALPPAPWRRPVLLVTGLSLVGLGVLVNAERLGLGADPTALALEDLEAETVVHGAKFSVDPDEHRDEKADDAGGSGQRHHGAEGKMGRPSPKSKSGLYAMKGPKDAVPQQARAFDAMQQSTGHFLASPYGGSFAVGNDDGDVWGGLGGTEVGESFGVGGLGLTGTGRGGGGTGYGVIGWGGIPEPDAKNPAEHYAPTTFNEFVETLKDAKSTFSIDVDTAAYSNARRYLLQEASLPPPEAVRTEEFINYFDYAYAPPTDAPFSVITEVGPAPWAPGHRLVQVGIQGKQVAAAETPPRNLVFLIDVSGSMSSSDKLPLVKAGLRALAKQMGSQDRISIVVYAGAAGAVLEPTRGDDHAAIDEALQQLEAGGSTNGAEGIHLAYRLARQSFIKGGINRVIIATDGDFNVGVVGHGALMKLIGQKRRSGVFLSVLGVGTGNLNDHMMEQLADQGNGNYAYIDSLLEARKVLVQQSSSLLHTIAKDVKIQVEFDPAVVAKHRLIGYENRVLAHRDFDDDTKDAGEIGAGHTVTALYEIVPTAAAADDPLMTLSLRYKEPDGDRSKKITVPVTDEGSSWSDTSDDYRFATSVAMFGQKLRGATSQEDTSWSSILELATGSLGPDPHCYRHQFAELVSLAGRLSGEDVPAPFATPCEPGQAPPARTIQGGIPYPAGIPSTEVKVTLEAPPPPPDDDDASFVLEVLRLLPPLLALPMFVMAFRRPRRLEIEDES